MPISYKEQQRQVQYYDFLVYVCGVEISNYVKSVEVHHTDRSAPGSASITLANPFDQWIMTTANFQGAYRMATDRYSERPKYNIYNKKKTLSQSLQIQRQSASQGTNFGGQLNQPAENIDGDASVVASATGGTQVNDFLERYAFGPGSCIFSKLDTVKIYIRNPYDDPDTVDKWIPFFTGTVDTKPFVTNFITGESSVTLSCYDVRQSMQGMRVAINPYKNSILVGGSTAPTSGLSTSNNGQSKIVSFTSTSAGFFADYYPTNNQPASSAYQNVFAGKTFVDAVGMVICGRTGWVNTPGTAGPNAGVKDGDGVGLFEPGQVFRYANPAQPKQSAGTVNDLSTWDLLCLFGSKGDFWTYSECQQEGVDSFWDGSSHPFTGQLHWLLPDKQLLTSSLIEETVGGSSDMMGSPDWTDRYSLLVQMASRLDYQFTVTGCGDIVFEFPMYDFHPKYFSQHPGVYTTEMHVRNENISDEGGEIVSGLECISMSTQIAKKEQTQALNATASQINVADWRVVVFSNTLASKYGAKVQSVSFSGITDHVAMVKMAVTEFQKRLAEANKLSLDMVFRPYLRPNRPFLYSERNRTRLGKTTTVGFSMPVLSEPTMSLGLGCVRLPLYNNSTGQTTFQHITGAEGFALSYNEIIEEPSGINFAGNGDRQIVSQTPTTPTGSTGQ